MKALSFISTLAFFVHAHAVKAVPTEGFFLPDSVREVTFNYRSVNNLIILPVRINENDVVNLVLDTGCRNLILFGKRFKNMIDTEEQRQISFNGLGQGKPARGFVTLENNVSFSKVIGKKIAIVVVPERNVFANYPIIDGIIGYELFLKFEIEVDFARHKITFRPASFSFPSTDFKLIPLRIEDSRPVVSCTIFFSETEEETCDLLIDTGSCLGLLFTAPQTGRINRMNSVVLGRGLNGYVSGKKLLANKVLLGDFALHDLSTGVVRSASHHYASLGTEVLKDYTLLINYYKGYAGLRQN